MNSASSQSAWRAKPGVRLPRERLDELRNDARRAVEQEHDRDERAGLLDVVGRRHHGNIGESPGGGKRPPCLLRRPCGTRLTRGVARRTTPLPTFRAVESCSDGRAMI